MKNYTILENNLKDETANYIKNITLGLGKVDTHFITDMFVGMLKHNSVILSDIVRQTGNINIKKGVERLERNLDSFDNIENVLMSNYIQMVKPYINNRHLYFVDRGDIVKKDNTKFENKGFVLDGSDSHNVKQGYQINEIATIDNDNQPISLVSELRSSKDNDYNSDNDLWISHMNYVHNIYGKGTFIMDRGYDGAILMEKVLEIGSDFIIRAKSLDRKIYVNGEKTTISDIAKHMKGKYSYVSKEYDKLKVSYKPVVIKSKEAKNLSKKVLTIVVVKGFALDDRTLNEAYMVLLTSRTISGKAQALQVVRDYALRWKIEENFKYKKQQFEIEKIKVRRYKRIQALNTLLTYVMFFSNVINLKAIGKTIRKIKNQIRDKILFWLYRISDGIKEIISFFSAELLSILYPSRNKRRRDLWTVMGVRYNPA
jgi:hypothetical protein